MAPSPLGVEDGEDGTGINISSTFQTARQNSSRGDEWSTTLDPRIDPSFLPSFLARVFRDRRVRSKVVGGGGG